MAKRKLDNWLKHYMEYTAALEAPETFHFWTGVSTIAGALRRQVWIDQLHFQWTPNFYIILVAPPGIVSKTTSLGVGSKLLRELPGINFGPNAITWQALIQTLAESTESVQMPDGSYHAMSCVTCSSGELGSLVDPHDRLMMDVLTDLWDGRVETWKKVTKTSGNDSVENPWINIIAATTPTWLADNLSETAVGGGFTSRCIFVFGNKKRHFCSLPRYHAHRPSPELRTALIHDLEYISMLKGEMDFTPEAVRWMDEWYVKFWQSDAASHEDRMSGYRARKQTHIVKLSMILSAAQRDTLQILPEDLDTALKIVESLEGQFQEVFEHIGQTETGRFTYALYGEVQKRGAVERHMLMRSLMRIMDERTFTTALNTAIGARLVIQVQRGDALIIVDQNCVKQTN